jgi:hypothetical protein
MTIEAECGLLLRVRCYCLKKADPSLTTPKLKKTLGAPFAQDDTISPSLK